MTLPLSGGDIKIFSRILVDWTLIMKIHRYVYTKVYTVYNRYTHCCKILKLLLITRILFQIKKIRTHDKTTTSQPFLVPLASCMETGRPQINLNLYSLVYGA
jgi:hypothetical protein